MGPTEHQNHGSDDIFPSSRPGHPRTRLLSPPSGHNGKVVKYAVTMFVFRSQRQHRLYMSSYITLKDCTGQGNQTPLDVEL